VITVIIEYDAEQATVGRALAVVGELFGWEPVQVLRWPPGAVAAHGARYGGVEPPSLRDQILIHLSAVDRPTTSEIGRALGRPGRGGTAAVERELTALETDGLVRQYWIRARLSRWSLRRDPVNQEAPAPGP
jgi:hypothetical protein